MIFFFYNNSWFPDFIDPIISNQHIRRQREQEGKSNTVEDVGLEYFSTLEEEDDDREGENYK